MLKKSVSMFLLVIASFACGNDDDDDVCGPKEGETHVANAVAQPSGSEWMLHLVGAGCVLSGANEFRLLPMTGANEWSLLSVEADMPSMGHGTAQPPVIDDPDGGVFTLAFQMPGAWEVTAEIRVGGEAAAERMVFQIDVH